MLLVGCSPGQYTEGITELELVGQTVVAVQCNPVVAEDDWPNLPTDLGYGYKARFDSGDGGFTWGERLFGNSECKPSRESFSQITPDGEFVMELGKGVALEGSPLGGVDTSFLSDPLFRMLTANQYEDRSPTRANYSATAAGGPYDAVLEPATGNLVVAMGLQGVLVRLPSGDWTRVGIDDFQPVSDSFSERIGLLKNIGVAAQAAFVGVLVVLWPLKLRRTWIAAPQAINRGPDG